MSRSKFLLLCLQRALLTCGLMVFFSQILEILTYHFFKYYFSATQDFLLFFKTFTFGDSLFWEQSSPRYLQGLYHHVVPLHKFHCIRVLPWSSHLKFHSLLYHFFCPAVFFIVLITSTSYILICSFIIVSF